MIQYENTIKERIVNNLGTATLVILQYASRRRTQIASGFALQRAMTDNSRHLRKHALRDLCWSRLAVVGHEDTFGASHAALHLILRDPGRVCRQSPVDSAIKSRYTRGSTTTMRLTDACQTID